MMMMVDGRGIPESSVPVYHFREGREEGRSIILGVLRLGGYVRENPDIQVEI
jgi:hypothetical protein